MPTLFTDPRSGGVKKSSGVRLLPQVAECEYHVRDLTHTIICLVPQLPTLYIGLYRLVGSP